MSTDNASPGIVHRREAWQCSCGCNNKANQVDCYSCGKPKTERPWHDPGCRCEFCKPKSAAEPAGVPPTPATALCRAALKAKAEGADA